MLLTKAPNSQQITFIFTGLLLDTTFYTFSLFYLRAYARYSVGDSGNPPLFLVHAEIKKQKNNRTYTLCFTSLLLVDNTLTSSVTNLCYNYFYYLQIPVCIAP